MLEPLVIAAAQPPCVPYDVAANAEAHASAVRSAQARVVVFPELSLTGYELDAAPVSVDDSRMDQLVEACAEVRALALVGAPVPSDADRPHIAMLAIDGSGTRVAYRKMHLGGAEAGSIAPGPDPEVLDVDGWRLGLAICRDTGVSQHAAAVAALGIDAYVAGTVKHAHESGLQDERARRIAVEHRIWVVVASCAGSTGGGFTAAAGRSGIWSSEGTQVAQCGPEPGAIARAVLV